jgi:hypothetical protein
MKQCKCGSYAINHHSHGRDGSDGDLCDVCYWRTRAERLREERRTLYAKIEQLTNKANESEKWKGIAQAKGYDQTIERCAEVCEQVKSDCDPFDAEIARECAAAIRALKEQQ